MTRWLLRRTLQAAATFAVAVLLLFVLMRVAPGDPLARLAGDREVSALEIAHLRARFGLDQPIAAQLRAFLAGVLRGDLGVSIEHYPERVNGLLGARLPPTLLLGGTVLLLNFGLGVWLGLVLVAFLSLRWHVFPAAQMTDPLLPAGAGPGARALDVLRHLALPALTLSVTSIAVTMRHQRAALLATFRHDYVLAARSRGLTERRVIWGHAWRNTLVPMLTLLGLWLPILVSGSVFVEAVFNWPGLGSLAAEAIAARDYPVLLGTAMLASGAVVAAGLLADLGYALVDPRVRPS